MQAFRRERRRRVFRRKSDLNFQPLARFNQLLKTHPISQFLGIIFAVVGGIVLIATGLHIVWDLRYREEDREARAWEVVFRPVPGNIGKGSALNILHSRKLELAGIDVSCERMNASWNAETLRCRNPPIVADVRMSDVVLANWNLSGASVSDADFASVHFVNVNLKGTSIVYSNLQRSLVEGELDGLRFFTVSLAGSTLAPVRREIRKELELPVDPLPATITLLGVDISNLVVVDQWFEFNTEATYAWADQPPVRIESDSHSDAFSAMGRDGPYAYPGRPSVYAGTLIDGVHLCDPRSVRIDLGGHHKDLTRMAIDAQTMLPINLDCERMTEEDARREFASAWGSIPLRSPTPSVEAEE